MNISTSSVNEMKSGFSNMMTKTKIIGSIMVDTVSLVIVHFIAGHLAVQIATKIDKLSTRKWSGLKSGDVPHFLLCYLLTDDINIIIKHMEDHMDIMERANQMLDTADKYCQAFAIGVILGSIMIGAIMLNDYMTSPKPEKPADE